MAFDRNKAPQVPGRPGLYWMTEPWLPMPLEQRAFEMWAVHPSQIKAMGYATREEFYLAHLKGAAAHGGTHS